MGSLDYKDAANLPPSRGAGTNQSNFAGTKTWAGGSSTIYQFAGPPKYADMSKSNGPGKPSRHPEGVKGGNSDFGYTR